MINPLVKFALDESGVLTFENPAVRAKYSGRSQGRLLGDVGAVRQRCRTGAGHRRADAVGPGTHPGAGRICPAPMARS